MEVAVSRTGVLKQAVQVEPGADQARSVSDVAAAVSDDAIEGVVLAFADGSRVPLPASLLDVVRASARELADGHTVTVLRGDSVLTPAEAGELLGLSRPFVARLLDEGTIPSERLPGSRHRRVLLADVLAFAQQRDRRRDGRRAVADAAANADLPY
jgi:excisionase family DNA binding protein